MAKVTKHFLCTPKEAVSQQMPETDTQTKTHRRTDAQTHAHQFDAHLHLALSIEPDQRGQQGVHLLSVVWPLQGQQGEASILRVADRYWHIWEVSN